MHCKYPKKWYPKSTYKYLLEITVLPKNNWNNQVLKEKYSVVMPPEFVNKSWEATIRSSLKLLAFSVCVSILTLTDFPFTWKLYKLCLEVQHCNGFIHEKKFTATNCTQMFKSCCCSLQNKKISKRNSKMYKILRMFLTTTTSSLNISISHNGLNQVNAILLRGIQNSVEHLQWSFSAS